MGTIGKMGRHIIIAMLLALSFSLVTAVPVSAAGTPTIDGVIDAGEWDGALEIPVASSMGTVKLLASTDYLYVLFDVIDTTDARLGQNLVGNDKIGLNINPTDGGPWGKPYDIVFQTGADPAAFTTTTPPGISSGMSDGWYTEWVVEGVQYDLPEDLETMTLYGGGTRISEWKVPLATIDPSMGDTLLVGGACDNLGPTEPAGGSYIYPVGLVWANASTYVGYWYGVKNLDTGLYYTTIQAAIDAASGTTLVCAPGIYNENVTIDKSLILLGAQAGNCAIGRTGDESVIDCGWVSGDPVPSAIEFTANDIDVTIDGFKIIGSRGAVTTKGLDKISVTLSALHFLNNIVEANTYPGGMNDAALVFVQAADIEVDCNDVSPTNVLSSQTNALRLTVTGVDSAVVDSNRLHNASSSGLGVQSNNPDAVITVKYNELRDNADDGMFTYNSGFKTLTISHNEIRNNTKIGVNIATGVRGTIRINCNNITGNNNFGVSVDDNYGGTVDAEYNWWGTVDGPGPVGSGSGDKITTKVDYYPYLSVQWQVSPICNPQPVPPPPSPGGAAVGIEVYSVNKAALLAPWIALAAVIIGGGIILVRRRKAHS